MAVTLFASGTQTATVTTEHDLPATPFINDDGVFELRVSMLNLAAGDRVELRAYAKLLTGDTAEVVYLGGPYDGPMPTDDMQKSVTIGNDLVETGAVRFTLKQTHGTGRNFKWKVLQYPA